MSQAKKEKNKTRQYHYRDRARSSGGVIVYAMITAPEAVAAWKKLQEIYGSNRDAIEAAIIDAYEQLGETS